MTEHLLLSVWRSPQSEAANRRMGPGTDVQNFQEEFRRHSTHAEGHVGARCVAGKTVLTSSDRCHGRCSKLCMFSMWLGVMTWPKPILGALTVI